MAEQKIPKLGPVKLDNPRLKEQVGDGPDFLYHFGMDSSMNIEESFGDVRFVLMCGSPDRAASIASAVREALSSIESIGNLVPTGPIAKTDRYSLYKVGPVIAVSHGMGMPSMSICMHEITKLLYYAKAENVVYIRIGTSGGLGLPPGTVVVSNGVVNGLLKEEYDLPVLGKLRSRPAHVWPGLAKAITKHAGGIRTAIGKTMGTDDFYEGQARLDGAFCDYEDSDKMEFLKEAHSEHSVLNIEMEGPYFAYFCTRLNIPGTLVCCTLLDRLKGDQIKSSSEELEEFQKNAIAVAVNYVVGTLREIL